MTPTLLTLESMKALKSWQENILEIAAGVFTTPAQPSIQEGVGLWSSGVTTVPPRNQLKILPNGCMVMDALLYSRRPAALKTLRFSVWLAVGEIRIGVKIPADVMSERMLQPDISRAYDGQPCDREEKLKNHILFDWIFRKDFASYEAMFASISSPLGSAVLAQRIGEIMTHLYFSIISKLTTPPNGDYGVTFQPSLNSPKTMRLVLVNGDHRQFEESIPELRARLIQKQGSAHGANDLHYWIETDDAGGRLTIQNERYSATEYAPDLSDAA